jgi:hypothetical protein
MRWLLAKKVRIARLSRHTLREKFVPGTYLPDDGITACFALRNPLVRSASKPSLSSCRFGACPSVQSS